MIFKKIYENIFQHTFVSSRKKLSGSGTIIHLFTKQSPSVEGHAKSFVLILGI